ncbi:Nickel-transporting ATPase [Syntrophobotulus glycolicus DSM 8271]|uniref:Nickel-transporting ATPase n=1 Tax=Syntrophobotulus glycolicus (strain DSM 8271 / FlGlyR) TaxID=645991 RepID=F0SZM8_SYNGF|nr:ABC transporter ATP-binding protein [Syntrophobotulus glycolicus]ADY56114.1 Nickel-transporting ATPase [Syntrophobotulus glycolicus DSM 8271]
MNNDIVLSVKGLHIAYPGEETKIQDITFSVRRGAVFGLAGESGSGKSSICKAILGLLENRTSIFSGSIRFCGRELTDLSGDQHRAINGKDIGYIMQNPMAAFDPCLKISAHFSETIRAHLPCSKRDALCLGLEMLERVGLSHADRMMNSYPGSLSGGMLQRIMTAIAISMNPILIIADEPTTALDTQSRETVLDLLSFVMREYCPAMLLVSHDMNLMEKMAEDIAIMYQGRIVESGSVKRVLENPQHEYTCQLIEASRFTWEEGRC